VYCLKSNNKKRKRMIKKIMQNKRRLLKRLIKEILSEDKGFLINESWNEFEKKENK